MLCVLILKWLITKCCLCLSKVVRALFLINDAKVQKIFQTSKFLPTIKDDFSDLK